MKYLTIVVAILASNSAPANATYSIVATDSATREVGGAGTSCIGTLETSTIYAATPAKGAVHAQAQVYIPGRNEAARLLSLDVAPVDIISQITAPAFDSLATRRQYAIVDLLGRAAAFTGRHNDSVAGDIQGMTESFAYSIQGNTLTSAAVLTQAQSAFVGSQAATGCDLAERLMLALEAGASNGQGDSRCTGPRNTPSDSAFLRVNRVDGTALIDIEVTNTGNASPLLALRAQFDAWRAKHACDLPIDDRAEPGGASRCGHASIADPSWLLIFAAIFSAMRFRSR